MAEGRRSQGPLRSLRKETSRVIVLESYRICSSLALLFPALQHLAKLLHSRGPQFLHLYNWNNNFIGL